MSKIYFHIDVNNAFLSWEAIYRLNNGDTTDIREIYSAVAGDPKNRTGIILAKSPKAKAMGVKTGEAIFESKRKCPELRLYPPHHDFYNMQSNKMKEFLTNYSDYIEPFSVDEVFIEHIPLLGSYMDVANEIQTRIKNELGFTVNIGISDTKYLAKVASDFEKPNKIHTLFSYEVKEKFWPLEIQDMFLVGKKTYTKLKAIGIDTVGKLANTNIEILRHHLKSHGEELYNYAWGKDMDKTHTKGETPKSIGHSKTSTFDLTKETDIHNFILDVVNETSKRLRSENMKATNITITLKTSKFYVYSHSITLDTPTSSTTEIFNISKKIFKEIYKGEPLRLIGISFSKLIPDSDSQLNIFDTLNKKENDIDKTIDSLLSKFNDSNLITRASLIKHKSEDI